MRWLISTQVADTNLTPRAFASGRSHSNEASKPWLSTISNALPPCPLPLAWPAIHLSPTAIGAIVSLCLFISSRVWFVQAHSLLGTRSWYPFHAPAARSIRPSSAARRPAGVHCSASSDRATPCTLPSNPSKISCSARTQGLRAISSTNLCTNQPVSHRRHVDGVRATRRDLIRALSQTMSCPSVAGRRG